MRCISCRQPGSATQPVSCPCVAPDQVPHAGRAQRGGEQPQRRGGAEERAVAAVPARRGPRPPGRSPGVGSSMPGGPADDRVRQRGVVLGRPRRVRGEHDHRVRRAAGQQRGDERLDAALPGREVVGDDERAGHGRVQPGPVLGDGHPLRPPSGASRRTTARPPGGSGSDEVGRRPAALHRRRTPPGRRSGRARARRPAPRCAGTRGSAPAWTAGCRPRPAGRAPAARRGGRRATSAPARRSSGGPGTAASRAAPTPPRRRARRSACR